MWPATVAARECIIDTGSPWISSISHLCGAHGPCIYTPRYIYRYIYICVYIYIHMYVYVYRALARRRGDLLGF